MGDPLSVAIGLEWQRWWLRVVEALTAWREGLLPIFSGSIHPGPAPPVPIRP